MIRSSVRSAGLAILLTMNGCGSFTSSRPGTGMPGLNVAQAALESGSGEIALRVSDGVLRGSPHDIRALEIKGDALVLIGEYDGAVAIYQALLAKDPNSVRANIGMGRIQLTKDPAAAEVLFQQALKRDPNDLTALNNLGIARDLQGHHAEAQTAYRQALAVTPDLDSAQVNLALSMAMSGQGAAAVKLLKARASLPGAPVKVKHDYAVVLALAGNRAEAERVLGEDLSPDEVRQVLDSVTGTHTRVTRGAAADQMESGGAMFVPPPDVVQVPEAASQDSIGRIPVSSLPAATPMAVAAAMTAPPPMVVRPRVIAEPESETPSPQPVNPAAAAIETQQSLALPWRGGAAFAGATAAPDPVVAAPAIVTATAPTERQSPVAGGTPPTAGRAAISEAPPVPSAIVQHRPDQPVQAAAQSEPPARQGEATLEAARPDVARAKVAPADVARPAVVRTEVARPESGRTESAQSDKVTAGRGRADATQSQSVLAGGQAAHSISPAPGIPTPPTQAVLAIIDTPAGGIVAAPRKAGTGTAVTTPGGHAAAAPPAPTMRRDDTTMVQFTAAGSQEAALSFWQDLVHRFPNDLGQREPVVIRFEHDGMVFWRVRTEGFGGLSEAQTLCARMRAGGQDCYVARS